jgi:hypothetical protein
MSNELNRVIAGMIFNSVKCQVLLLRIRNYSLIDSVLQKSYFLKRSAMETFINNAELERHSKQIQTSRYYIALANSPAPA